MSLIGDVRAAHRRALHGDRAPPIHLSLRPVDAALVLRAIEVAPRLLTTLEAARLAKVEGRLRLRIRLHRRDGGAQ